MTNRLFILFLSLVALLVIAVGTVVFIVVRQSNQTIADAGRPVAKIEAEPIAVFTPEPPSTQPTTQFTGPTVRCAVINGMNITGLWKAVTDRFTAETGIRVETVTFGEKAIIDKSFRQGGVDLLTMHACDKVINLVADGLAKDPQPWARNDQVLVGPANDPARIRGLRDAAEAFRRIVASRSPFVMHSSLGTQEVMRAVLEEAQVQLDPALVTPLMDDAGRDVLKIAAEKKAYTLIGRIPFRLGRLPNAGLELMVEGDPRLRRPYVVVVADPARVKDAHVEPAMKLAAYLRSPRTQAWLATWGVGLIDRRPVFFPVQTEAK